MTEKTLKEKIIEILERDSIYDSWTPPDVLADEIIELFNSQLKKEEKP